MLVTLQEMIAMAEKGHYAVPAFNVYNIETVMGVVKAAEEMRAPVIMQVYPRLLNEEVGYYLAPVILAAAAKAKVPVMAVVKADAYGHGAIQVARLLQDRAAFFGAR